MDSKQLYNTAKHLNTVITWEKDWIHFGTGKEAKLGLILELVDSFFSGETVTLVHDRQNSREHAKAEVMFEIKNLLGQENFQLCDEKLTKVIKFDKIGVLKLGQK
jgi:hypothetical protein